MIGRREFVTLLGGTAAWPLAAVAQQMAKMPTIGFLDGATPSVESQRVAAFVQRLRELAWVDGRNVAIESRWAEGRPERVSEIAAEFVLSLSRWEPPQLWRPSKQHRPSLSSLRERGTRSAPA